MNDRVWYMRRNFYGFEPLEVQSDAAFDAAMDALVAEHPDAMDVQSPVDFNADHGGCPPYEF